MTKGIGFFVIISCWFSIQLLGQAGPQFSPHASSSETEKAAEGTTESVSLNSGTVNLPVVLASVAGRNGLDGQVAIQYNSAIEHLATMNNRDAPSGVLGLGWSLSLPHILVDHKNTGTRLDDDYYLMSGGAGTLLRRTGKVPGTSKLIYTAEQENFHQIIYSPNDDFWEITDLDGTKYYYGGSEVSGDGTDARTIVVANRNWIGNTGNFTLPRSCTSGYYLKRVTNHWGDFLKYTYEQDKESVGNSGAVKHTQSIRLKDIETSTGNKLSLTYKSKIYRTNKEYDDPHLERSEPDGYQEEFETNYLSQVDVYGPEGKLDMVRLSYQTKGDGLYFKRLLSGIAYSNGLGNIKKSTSKFSYITDGSPNQYKLQTFTNASGGRTTYHYSQLKIAGNSFDYPSAPTGYAEPRVWIEDDYVVVTWRALDNGKHVNTAKNVKIQVYAWNGFWEKKLENNIPNVKVQKGQQQFEVLTGKHFFAVNVHTPDDEANPLSGKKYKTHLFYRNRLLDTWIATFQFTPTNTYEEVEVIVGDKFLAAIGSSGAGRRFVYTGSGFDIQSLNYSDGSSSFYAAGANNYILLHNRSNSSIRMLFLEDGYEWKEKVLPSSLNIGMGTWSASNSFAVYAANGYSTYYVYYWDESAGDYNFYRQSVDFPYNSTEYHYKAPLDNSTFSLISGENLVVGRFNGTILTTTPLLKARDVPSMAVSNDKYLYLDEYNQVKYGKFSPSFGVWYNNISLWTGNSETKISIGNKYFNAGTITYYYDHLGFRRQVSTDGYLPPAFTKKSMASDIGSISYILYDVDNGSYSGNKVVANKLKNHEVVETSAIGGHVINGSFYVKPYDTDRGDFPELVRGNIFLTWQSSKKFEDVTSLNLYHINETEGIWESNVYPITQIDVSDEFETRSTTLQYDTETAVLDKQSRFPMFGKVTVIPGSSNPAYKPFGSVIYNFYNGFQYEDFLPLPYEDYKNTSNYFYLKGLMFRKQVIGIDADQNERLISKEDHQYGTRVISEGNVRVYDSKLMRLVSEVEGVASSKDYEYNGKGQLAAENMKFYDAKGVPNYLSKEYKYLWEVSAQADAAHLWNPVVQESSSNCPEGSNCASESSVTKWKNWGGGKWAPWKTYLWTGKGSKAFSDWTSEPSTDWLLTAEVKSRDSYGNVLETINNEGIRSSTLWAYNSTLPVMNVNNTTAVEFLYDDFNNSNLTDNDPVTWGYNSGWDTSNGTLSQGFVYTGSSSVAGIYYSKYNNYILDINFRLGSEGSTNNEFGVRLNKSTASDYPRESGLTLFVNESGAVQLKNTSGTILASSQLSEALFDWNSLKIVRKSNQTLVYINSELQFSASNSLTGTYFGFFLPYLSEVELDNFRMYPSEALASSTSYHPDFKYPISQAGDDGESVRYLYNENHQQIATINHRGVPVETSSHYSRYNNVGTLSTADPASVHETAVRGLKGTYMDFQSPIDLLRWEEIDRPNGVSTDWKIYNGELQTSNPGGATDTSTDMLVLDMGEELKGRVGVEYDLKIGYAPTDWSFGLALGGDDWDKINGGNENAVWSAFQAKNYKVYNQTDGWKDSQAHFRVGVTYRMKVVVDMENQTADYYVDGKLVIASYPLRESTTGIQKIAFFNYGKTSYSGIHIDNLVVYTDPEHATIFVDALGEIRQSQTELPNNKIMVSESLYDALGRAAVSVKPTRVNARFGYRESFVSSYNWVTDVMAGAVVSLNPEDEGYPYSRTIFEDSPLDRALTRSRPGKELNLASNKNPKVKYFDAERNDANFHFTHFTDSEGVESYTKNDVLGREVEKSFSNEVDAPLNKVSYEYDQKGNLTKIYPPNYHFPPTGTTDPNSFVTSMTYDHFGRVKTRKTPDNGTYRYYYEEKTGRLRYMQDANGATASPEYFMYFEYDKWGRTTEEGYVYQKYDEDIFDGLAGPEGSTNLNLQDQVISGDYFGKNINASGATLSGKTALYAKEEIILGPGFTVTAGQTFAAKAVGGKKVWRKRYEYGEYEDQLTARGAMTKVLVNNDEDEAAEVEEYLEFDRNTNLARIGTKVADYEATPTYVSYTYDNLGNVLTEDFGAPFGPVKYSYHQDGSLKSIGTTTDEDQFATYAYNKNGQLGVEKLNNSSYSIDYSYQSAGWLKKIASNRFTEELSYTSGGYGGASNYNGLIASTDFSYSADQARPNYTYKYKYDKMSRLETADNTNSTLGSWDLGVSAPVGFDGNGNILSMKKGSETSNYTYDPNTNRVNRISGAERQYQYDANGNITKSLTKNLNQLAYDPFFNKVNKISGEEEGGSITMHLQYGADNERAYKYDEELDIYTAYFRGGNSYPLIEKQKYANGTEKVTYNLQGPTGLLAVYQEDNWYYMLKDHLGSTRVVMNTSNQEVNGYDYLPFGELRSYISGGEKMAYKFGGQEYDKEVGLHNFRARMYDSELGRFYAFDPANQFHSPYTGIANNPVNFVDPDGEWSWVAFGIGAVVGGGIGAAYGLTYDRDNWYWYAAGGALGGGLLGGVLFDQPATFLSNSHVLDQLTFHDFSFSSGNASSMLRGSGFAQAPKSLTARLGGGILGEMASQGQPAQNAGRLFPDEGRAYQFMWKSSFDTDGKVKHEVAAFLTSEGVIVLPTEGIRPNGQYAKNGPRKSYSDFLPFKQNVTNGNWYVKFEGNVYHVLGQVHTHPNTQKISVEEFAPDIAFQRSQGLPTYIIRTNGFYNMRYEKMGTQQEYFRGIKSLILGR